MTSTAYNIIIFIVILGVILIIVNKSKFIQHLLFISEEDIDIDGQINIITIAKKVFYLFVIMVVIGVTITETTTFKPTPLGVFSFFVILAMLNTYLDKTDNKAVKKDFTKQTDSLTFNVKDRIKRIIINNPFRGIFVSGGAGAGKSKSIIEPIIQQAGANNYAGIVYDFKFPTLAREVAGSYSKSDIKTYYVNFTDLTRSNMVNPISPEYITNAIFARESALTILTNIDAKAVEKRDFWVQSAEALLTGIIWFLRNNYPEYCTVPHAVSLVIESEPKKLIELLSKDDEVRGIIASLRSAQESENTLAGMFATVQNYLSVLNTRDLFWVLQKSDFSLVLNNLEEPKMLVIGNNSMISKSLSPIIALIISTALKQMNQEGRHKSMIILDEAPTINIPNFAQIPATGRSSKMATVYAVQDIAQMESELGKQESEKILANLNTQFYGRTTNVATAERVSKLFGDYEKEIVTRSKGKSDGASIFDHDKATVNQNKSTTVQLRKVIEPSELTKADVGTFACLLAESNVSEFFGAFEGGKSLAKEIEPFAKVTEEMLKTNFKQVKEEAKFILKTDLTDKF